jgi:general secretion pathway protein A
MYERHWKLRGRPFENNADDTGYYPATAHQSALLKLRYALESTRALAVLSGESGMGKTLLARMLVKQLAPELSPVVHIAFPRLPPTELLAYICDLLCGQPGDGGSLRQIVHRWDDLLTKNLAANRHAVVILDDAQALLGNESLDLLAAALNLPAAGCRGESAWTLLLVGEPPLLVELERRRDLHERIAVKCTLPRLTSDETIGYLQQRLRAVGGVADRIFTLDAMEVLHLRAAGIPQRVNRLADLALLVGFAEDRRLLDAPQIESVYAELIAVGPPTV